MWRQKGVGRGKEGLKSLSTVAYSIFFICTKFRSMSKRSVIFIIETQELVLGFLTSLNCTMLTEYLKYAQKFSLYRSKKKKKKKKRRRRRRRRKVILQVNYHTNSQQRHNQVKRRSRCIVRKLSIHTPLAYHW